MKKKGLLVSANYEPVAEIALAGAVDSAEAASRRKARPTAAMAAMSRIMDMYSLLRDIEEPWRAQCCSRDLDRVPFKFLPRVAGTINN
jgi:hypothetical protein